MSEASQSIFQNVTFLRVLTIFTSFLFIPAFMFGVASVWSVVFSVVIAYFFRQRLVRIISIIENSQVYRGSSRKYLLLLILECILIAIIPSLICVLFDNFTAVATGYDADFYKSFAGFLYEAGSFSDLSKNNQILLVYIFNIPVLCIVLSALSFLRLGEILESGAYKKKQKNEQARYPTKFYRDSWYGFVFDAITFLAALTLFSPYFFDGFLFKEKVFLFPEIIFWLGLIISLPYIFLFAVSSAYVSSGLTKSCLHGSQRKMSEWLESKHIKK